MASAPQSFDSSIPTTYTQFMTSGVDWPGTEPTNRAADGVYSGRNLTVPADPGGDGGLFSFNNNTRLKILSIYMDTDVGLHWKIDLIAVDGTIRELIFGGPGIHFLEHDKDLLGFVIPGEAVKITGTGSQGTGGKASAMTIKVASAARK